MKNSEFLRQWLCNKIMEMSERDLYEILLEPKPVINGLCRYCEPLWGICPEESETDEVCIDRFEKWCLEEDNM